MHMQEELAASCWPLVGKRIVRFIEATHLGVHHECVGQHQADGVASVYKCKGMEIR